MKNKQKIAVYIHIKLLQYEYISMHPCKIFNDFYDIINISIFFLAVHSDLKEILVQLHWII